MKIYNNPSRDEWPALLRRPAKDLASLRAPVSEIMETVRAEGDQALRTFTARFDGIELDALQVDPTTLAAAGKQLSAELRDAIQTAKRNIEAFHLAQQTKVTEIQTMPG
ncbi:MAG: histidinol dehydrogenase, partial [Bacteroidota bacterium]